MDQRGGDGMFFNSGEFLSMLLKRSCAAITKSLGATGREGNLFAAVLSSDS